MTSLSASGDAKLRAMTEAAFAAEMERWQAAIETNGTAIRAWLNSRH